MEDSYYSSVQFLGSKKMGDGNDEKEDRACQQQFIEQDSRIIVDCVDLKVEEIEDTDVNENLEFESEYNNTDCLEDYDQTSLKIPRPSLPLAIEWPDNVQLYQHYEDTQILFSEVPNSLYVQAILRICNLRYTLVEKSNAESIGPSGELPVLRCGKFIVSGAEKIVQFVERKGMSLTDCFEESVKIEMNAFMSLIKMTLVNAEDFLTWMEPETFKEITWNRFCSVHPWPLSSILIGQKRQMTKNKLSAMGWEFKTYEEVCDDVNKCFEALSNKLGRGFFYSNKPTFLDALVFSHTYTILTTSLPKSHFAGIILGYPKLIKHCHMIMESYFKELSTSYQFAELVNILAN